MNDSSRRWAAAVLVLYAFALVVGPLVLRLLFGEFVHATNRLREDLWLTQAATMLALSLLALRYVDDTALPAGAHAAVRMTIALAAITFTMTRFVFVLTSDGIVPPAVHHLDVAARLALALSLATLGLGLLRSLRR